MSFRYRGPGGSGGTDDDDGDDDSSSDSTSSGSSAGESGLGGSIPGAPSSESSSTSSSSSGSSSSGSSTRDEPVSGSDSSGGSSFIGDPTPDADSGTSSTDQAVRGGTAGGSTFDDVGDEATTGSGGMDTEQATSGAPEQVTVPLSPAEIGRRRREVVEARQEEAEASQGADITAQRQSQTDSFRDRAADEFDTEPENIDITRDGNTLTAEQDLTDEQFRADQITGGRVEPVVDAGQSFREDAAEATGGAFESIGQGLVAPGVLAGNAAADGLEATTGFDVRSVEAPGVVDDIADGGLDAEDALALGAAGVVTPEPSTSVGGAALAGGALIGLGAAELNRRSEIDAPTEPERMQTELDVGTGDVEATEIDTPTTRQTGTNELDVGTGDVEATEIGTPSDGSRTTEVDVPTVEAAGVSQGVGRQREVVEEDEPDFIIDDSVIEDTGPTVDIPEEEQMRQIREELERRQEFVRDDIDDVTQVDRQPIRFPAEQATTSPSVEADTVEAVEPGFETGTGTGSVTDPVFGIGPGADTDVEADTDLDIGADVGVGLDIGFEAPTVQAANSRLDTFADTAVEATVEATGFEATTTSTTTEPTSTEFLNNSTNRRREKPRFGLSGDELDELDDIGQGVEADTFEFELDLPDFIR